MNEARARDLLDPPSGPPPFYLDRRGDEILIDGTGTLEQLRAVVWWLENKPGEAFPG